MLADGNSGVVNADGEVAHCASRREVNLDGGVDERHWFTNL